jgi:hypothetical protein
VREKHRILRTRALALKDRARVLADAFLDPSTRRCVEHLLLGIDEELAWLDAHGRAAPLPTVAEFLPGTTEAIGLLERLLRQDGRGVVLKAALIGLPDLSRALVKASAEPAARKGRTARPGDAVPH